MASHGDIDIEEANQQIVLSSPAAMGVQAAVEPSPGMAECEAPPPAETLAHKMAILLQKGSELAVHKARVEAERALEQAEEVRVRTVRQHVAAAAMLFKTCHKAYSAGTTLALDELM